MMSDNAWYPITLEYLLRRRGIVKVKIDNTVHYFSDKDMRRLADSPIQPETVRARVLDDFLSEMDEGQMILLEFRVPVLRAHGISYRLWYYITFGPGHTHMHKGEMIDKHTVALLAASDDEDAREQATKLFGIKFSAISSERPDMRRFLRDKYV